MSRPAVAIIVDPKIARAADLVDTCCQHDLISDALAFQETLQALMQLATDDPVKLFLISNDADIDEVMSLIISAKEMPPSADAVYVMYAEEGEEIEEIFGIDKTLTLPLTTEKLADILGASEDIQKKNQQARMSSSVALMLSTAISEIDRVAGELKKGRSNAKISKQITEGCKFFHELAEDQLSSFYSTIFETFDEMEKILGHSHQNQKDANYTENAPLDDLEAALLEKLSEIK